MSGNCKWKASLEILRTAPPTPSELLFEDTAPGSGGLVIGIGRAENEKIWLPVSDPSSLSIFKYLFKVEHYSVS